jgi:hypothetical protein
MKTASATSFMKAVSVAYIDISSHSVLNPTYFVLTKDHLRVASLPKIAFIN